MFDSDEKDDERFANFMIYKIWATDKEIEDMSPVLIVLGVIIIALIIALATIFA